jgi:hypothetical protein
MKLTYLLTLEDYKAAHVLHARQTIGRRITEFTFYLGMQILAAVVVMMTFAAAVMGNRYLVTTLIPVDAGVLWVAIFLPVARAISQRRCFKQLFPPNRTDRASHLEISEECILSGVPGLSEAKIYWPAVFAFAQDDRITMIYLAPRRFVFFPTSVLDSEQRAELNALVKMLVKGKISC